MTIATDRRYTVEEFVRLPLDGVWELIDGVPVEKDPIEPRTGKPQMGNPANIVSGNAYFLLRTQLQNLGHGLVVPECWIRGFGDDRSDVRRPDVAFFAAGTLPAGPMPEVSVVMPTLAIESISPGNSADEIERKVDEYLAAGVRLVWLAFPGLRALRIHRADETMRRYREADTFADEPLLPGLTFRVAELFALPGKTQS